MGEVNVSPQRIYFPLQGMILSANQSQCANVVAKTISVVPIFVFFPFIYIFHANGPLILGIITSNRATNSPVVCDFNSSSQLILHLKL